MRKRERQRPLWHTPTLVITGLVWGVFALYLYQLDSQSLWRDEILSVARAHQSLPQILSNINIVTGIESPDLHPPFYFLVLSFWHQAAGTTEFAYRYFSVLMSVLAIPLFYACGSRIWSRTSGIWTAVFASFSPIFLWYAQETRMYALLVVETLLVIFTLWPLLLPNAKKRDFVYFGLAMAVTLYTHYSGLYLLGFSLFAIIVLQLFHSRFQTHITWKLMALVTFTTVALLLLSMPLYPNLRELLTANGFIAFGRPSPLWLLQTGLNTFTQGSTNPPDLPVWRMLPFILLIGVGALSLDVKPPYRRMRAILISLGGLVGTLVLFYAVSFLQANYSNPRHLMVISPFVFLLMGYGVVTLYRHLKVAAVFVGGSALMFSAFTLYQTVTAPPVIRDDVRALAAYIEEHTQPGDSVIWHNAVMSMVYDYYQTGLPTAVIPQYAQYDETTVLNELATWKTNSERIWFVRYPSPPFFDETIVYADLNNNWVNLDGAGFSASWAILSVELFKPLQKAVTLPKYALPATLNQDDYKIHGLTITPTKTIDNGTWATLYWEYGGDSLESSKKACVQLQDEANTVWAEACPFLRIPQNEPLPVAGIIAQDFWLPIPPGLAPIPYDVVVAMDDQTETLGTFSLERPLSTPPSTPVIAYKNGLNLVDKTWFDDRFQAGYWVLGDLVWQTTQPQTDKLIIQARLVDWLGRPISSQDTPVAPTAFSEDQWLPDDLIRTRLAVPIPYRLNGRYRLQIALTDETGNPIATKSWLPGKSWTTLDTIIIEDRPLVDALPVNSIPLTDEIILGDNEIALKAYNLEQDEAGNLVVTLHWLSLAEPDKDYATFVHIGQAGSPPLAQGGGPNWEYPTQSWRSGEIITQTFTIVLPEKLADNSAGVQVGMYDVNDPNARLQLWVNGQETPDNAYTLSTIP